MSRKKRNIWHGFLKIFGDIKVFRFPFFLIYDPGSYKLKGDEIREVISRIQPGDILLRGYDNYLDGFFIPGCFSHAGLYVGPVAAEDIRHVPTQEGRSCFKTGTQMVVHSMAEGVFMEDVINFCRCDRMLILRFPPTLTGAGPGSPSITHFSGEETTLARQLSKGRSLRFADVWPARLENPTTSTSISTRPGIFHAPNLCRSAINPYIHATGSQPRPASCGDS